MLRRAAINCPPHQEGLTDQLDLLLPHTVFPLKRAVVELRLLGNPLCREQSASGTHYLTVSLEL